MNKLIALVASVGLVALVGCSRTQQEVGKAPVGTAVGAGAGALAGAAIGDTTGALIGAVLGGVAGNQIEQALDDSDRERMERSFETGEPVTIEKGERDIQVRVIPMDYIPGYRGYDNCRSFRLEAVRGGMVDRGAGVACEVDGEWRVVEEGV